jgi:hypothetical protein
MSVIYLKHPIHGMKVAVSNNEAEYDVANGWGIIEDFDKVSEVETIDEFEESPAKRGRPKKVEV